MPPKTIDDATLTSLVFDTFRSYGYDGTTIALLSQVTGLKKSSLYHRFPAGKADMAKAVVRFMQQQIQQDIIMPLLQQQTAPEQRLENLLSTLGALYQDGEKHCLLNVMNLGQVLPDIKTGLNQIYDGFLYALEKLAKEAGMEATQALNWAHRFLIFFEGALVIQKLTNKKEIFAQQLAYEQQQFLNQIASVQQ